MEAARRRWGGAARVLLLVAIGFFPSMTGAQRARIVDHPVTIPNLHGALEVGIGIFGGSEGGWTHLGGWGMGEVLPHVFLQGAGAFEMLEGFKPRMLEGSVAWVSGRAVRTRYTVTVDVDLVASARVVTSAGTYEARQYEVTRAPIHGISRDGLGLRLGGMYRSHTWNDDESGRIHHFLAGYAGLVFVEENAYDGSVEGYGRYGRNDYAFTGFDLVYDVLVDEDAVRSWGGEDRTRFGFRTWGVYGFNGDPLGVMSRIEMGYLPSGSGWYFLLTVGLSLDLDVGGARFTGSG